MVSNSVPEFPSFGDSVFDNNLMESSNEIPNFVPETVDPNTPLQEVINDSLPVPNTNVDPPPIQPVSSLRKSSRNATKPA